MSSTDSEWLTLGEAARMLGVAQSTLRKWADSGEVQAFHTPGRHRRFRRSDLQAMQSTDEQVPHGRTGGAPEVLIVDDDPGMREMVAEAFKQGGWRSRTSGSARDAIAQLNLRLPDLMLLDVVMPGTDGIELMRMVRAKLGPSDLPILIYSGVTDRSELARAAAGGAQGHAAKPFNPYTLVQQANAIRVAED